MPMICREHLEEMLGHTTTAEQQLFAAVRGAERVAERRRVMYEPVKVITTLPDEVWAVGILREEAAYRTPILVNEGLGLAPLSVLDADGEQALPVFTTREKAERGILHFMSEEERTENTVGAALIDLEELLRAMREAPAEAPKIDYIGVNMGEGGIYPLIRP
jgi:hypothetical protein